MKIEPGTEVVTLDDMKGTVVGKMDRRIGESLYYVVIDGLEELGSTLYREEELRPS